MVIQQEHQLQLGILSNPTIPTVKTKTQHMYARGKANPKFFSTKSAVLKQQIHCEAKNRSFVLSLSDLPNSKAINSQLY